MDLSDFKNKLGIPKQDFHEKRLNLFQHYFVAYNDFVGTIGLSIILTIIIGLPLYFYFQLSQLKLNELLKYWFCLFVYSLCILFFLGILFHKLFNVNSESDNIVLLFFFIILIVLFIIV